MTSSIDAGATAEEGRKIRESKCEKEGEHKWKEYGQWPSRWGVCQKCGEHWYSK